MSKPKFTRILSIDGGGIRGIIPAQVLVHLEKILQNKKENPDLKLADCFDLIAGTSTGGIIACMMLLPDSNDQKKSKYPASKLVEIYLDRGDEIFSIPILHRLRTIGGFSDEKYPNEELLETLDDYLGNTMLSQLLKPTIITAYDIRRRKAHFFRQHKARGNPERDFRVRDVAWATSAAPTYFEVSRVKSKAGTVYPLIDGGVFANNPALCAYAEARSSLPSNPKAKDIILLSLGTGKEKKSYSYNEAKDWGPLGWAKPVLGIMMSGVAETVNYQLDQIYDSVEASNQFLRIEPDLSGASPDMDDASYENLDKLKKAGTKAADDHEQELEDFATLLLKEEDNP